MNNQISFSSTLYDCATECALKRQKKKCKNKFDSMVCNNCKLYVKRYINADPRHVELFMLKAETRAYKLRSISNGHHPFFFIAMAACLLLAGRSYRSENERLIYWGLKEPRNNHTERTSNQTVQENIDFALRQVKRDIEARVDVNGDGLSNCIDAAVRFYYHFPDKNKVRIIVNYNPSKDMHHLFNAVLINANWRTIEPQAYNKNWNKYFMEDIWGSQYDSAFDKVITQDYLMYAK